MRRVGFITSLCLLLAIGAALKYNLALRLADVYFSATEPKLDNILCSKIHKETMMLHTSTHELEDFAKNDDQTQGQLEEAIFDFTNTLTSTIYNNSGNVYQKEGDFTKAIEYYNRSLAIYPMFAATVYNRGNAYLAQRNIEAAIADYNQALKLNSDLLAAYNNRANAYYQQHQLSRAISDLIHVLQLDPKHDKAHLNLITFLKNSKNTVIFYEVRNLSKNELILLEKNIKEDHLLYIKIKSIIKTALINNNDFFPASPTINLTTNHDDSNRPYQRTGKTFL